VHLVPRAAESPNVRLQADLDERQVRLDGAKYGEGSEVSLLGQVERLTEDNPHLKNLLETKQFIDKFIKDYREGTQGNPEGIIKALKAENQRLDHALKDKEEQLKAFDLAPANAPPVAAYTNLHGEYKDLFRENQLKDQLYGHEQDEKKALRPAGPREDLPDQRKPAVESGAGNRQARGRGGAQGRALECGIGKRDFGPAHQI
jgi:hypothetical protein